MLGAANFSQFHDALRSEGEAFDRSDFSPNDNTSTDVGRSNASALLDDKQVISYFKHIVHSKLQELVKEKGAFAFSAPAEVDREFINEITEDNRNAMEEHYQVLLADFLHEIDSSFDVSVLQARTIKTGSRRSFPNNITYNYFPDAAEMNAELRAQGLRVNTYKLFMLVRLNATGHDEQQRSLIFTPDWIRNRHPEYDWTGEERKAVRGCLAMDGSIVLFLEYDLVKIADNHSFGGVTVMSYNTGKFKETGSDEYTAWSALAESRVMYSSRAFRSMIAEAVNQRRTDYLGILTEESYQTNIVLTNVIEQTLTHFNIDKNLLSDEYISAIKLKLVGQVVSERDQDVAVVEVVLPDSKYAHVEVTREHKSGIMSIAFKQTSLLEA